MNNIIEGIWVSRYAYGKGLNSEPQTSSHQIEFTFDDGKWVGKSLPREDGSKVTLILDQNGKEFGGKWHEHTSLDGYYQGKEFSGLILLLLQQNDTELTGMWLGASSSSNRIKAGLWTFTKE